MEEDKAARVVRALIKYIEAEKEVRRELEGITMKDVERGFRHRDASKAPVDAVRRTVVKLAKESTFTASGLYACMAEWDRGLVCGPRGVGAAFRELRKEGLVAPAAQKGFWRRKV